jgi:D-3-phosphoglycerate dehydrogenase
MSGTNGKFRVLVADKIAMDALVPLRSDARFQVEEKQGLSGEELARAIATADAVIVRSATKIPREALAYADRLKVIGRAGVGVDTIDVNAATERGIAVLNAPAGNTVSAAELTFALLLARVRRIAAADRSMRAGKWERSAFAGTELYGKTLGLVGAGRIGGEVAKRALAFGMQVLVYDPYLTEERAEALGVQLVSLDDLLSRSDFISLHVPLTEATTGLIGAEQIARMKKTAILVNAARGEVIDEDALVAALREGRIAGAALDVYATEPLPADHPLRSLDNVILTPHLGASTAEAQANVALEIAEAVRAALVDGDYSRAVNAPAIGGEAARRLRPMLDLAVRLGKIAAALVDGPVRRVDVRYAGESDDALRPLAATAMVGVLENVVGASQVNYVNSLHIATSRGIDVRQTRLGPNADYTEYLEVRLGHKGDEVRVAGALLGSHPRIVAIGDYRVNIEPRGTIIVLKNRDVPGVIGRVGTLLGDARINIAEYHQARLEAGGVALGAINTDGRLSPELIQTLRALPEMLDVRQVQLGS